MYKEGKWIIEYYVNYYANDRLSNWTASTLNTAMSLEDALRRLATRRPGHFRTFDLIYRIRHVDTGEIIPFEILGI